MENGKYVILCVDDDPEVLEWIQLTLEANGYHVRTAANSEEGVRSFKESPPDLIFVDLMMEEIDAGTDFVTKIRSLGNVAPIFMLTAAGNELVSTIDYSELGLDGVYQKPIDDKTLLSVLKTKLQ